MKFEQGTHCWIPDDRIGWLGVHVTRVDYDDITKKYKIELVNDENHNESFVVETTNLSESNDKLPKLRNMDDTVDDLTTLSHLNEPSVLNSVKLRYAKRKIYTFSGIVLIAINPFDRVDQLYTQEIIKKYQNVNKNENPPHLFTISDDAYKQMKLNKISQSIIVSGESGAGKTVSAKYIMRFFASVHTEGTQINTIEIEKQILATNPIMESFGNAKTTRNDNSSRFGKYLKISFDENSSICGAKIQTYLLERSRLVHQALNERNYHIFYQMIAGLPENLKTELSLTNCQDYHYLYGGETLTIPGVDDAKEFKDTCEALKIVGIDEHQQFELFKILSALLHIGNIHIENSRNEAILLDDEPNLLIACNLLGIDSREFRKWIIKKKISTRSDNIASNLKYHESLVAKDSVSKYIYSLLFEWLVNYINKDLCSPEHESRQKSFIGVLDIYGFEHFDLNSFEQFCINYANEKLQQEFTNHVFKLQQEDYIKEGIEWSFIKYADNQACIDVIENREGIFSLLDEQCKLPSGSDKAWAEKMFHGLAKPPYNKVFKKARFGNEKFIVSHYALDVTYEVDGFLEKNRDTVSDALNEVLHNSKSAFLKDVLSLDDKTVSSASAVQPKRRSVNRKPTLGYLFRNSLNELMTTINSTDTHYIRCIKPNESKKAWEFDNLMVLSQLRACGVLETIRISLVGFPSKYTYEEFLHRFCVLLPADDEVKFKRGEVKTDFEMKKFCAKILMTLITDNTSYQFGKSKIFFRAGVLGQLEIAKTHKLKTSVITIQKHLRRYLTRNKWLEARSSMVALQSLIRGSLVRQRILCENKASIKIQSLARGFLTRQNTEKQKVSAIKLQSYVRGMKCRSAYKQLVLMKKEAEARRLQMEKEEKQKLERRKQLMKEEEARKKRELELETLRKKEEARAAAELAAADAGVEYLRSEQGRYDQRSFSQSTTNESAAEFHDARDSYYSGSEGNRYSQQNEFIFRNEDSDNLLFSNITNTPLSEFVLSDNDDDGTEEVWHILENSYHPLKYSNEDLLGMRPSKALAIVSRYLVLRIKNISEKIDAYEQKHPNIPQIEISNRLTHNMKEDVNKLKRTLRRNKYTKPDMAVKRLSVKSVGSISTDKIMFGQGSDPDHLDRNYRSGYADLLEYMQGSPIAATLVANLLLNNMTPPERSLDNPPSVGEVLFPSRLVVILLRDLWATGLVNQSAIFLEKVVNIFKDEIETLIDPDAVISKGAYLLNNVNEIRTCIAWSRYTAMSDFNNKNFTAEERQNYLKMLLIMKRYCETVFGQMYNVWIKSILNQLTEKLTDAVLLDTTQYQIKQHIISSFSSTFDRIKYTMFDVVRIFSNVHLAMKSYCFDEVILTSVLHDLLIYSDVFCFNEVMTSDSYITPDKGFIIKENLSYLISWCKDHNIPDAPNKLMHLLSLCQILQLKKQGLADIGMLVQICDSINRKQIERILYECDKNTDADINGNESQFNGVHSDRSGSAKENGYSSDSSDYIIPIENDAFENAFLCMN